jgi:hypothetical protein
MGDWLGGYINPASGYPKLTPGLAGEIIGVKDGAYEIHLFADFDKRSEREFDKTVKPVNGKLNYADEKWKIEVTDSLISGSFKVRIKNEDVLIPIELKKVQRLSPTLGRPAPAGADILFANGNLDQWEHKKDQPATWKILPEGVIECVPYSKDIQTKKLYKDFEMHLEFKMPYEPDNTGQDRGNSGLFIQGVYEIQILDSYGVPGSLRDCGAIYRVSPPKINMSAPPEQWQTYDIIFKAARFDESGKLLEYPVITVKHNDTLIHHLKTIEEIPTHAKDGRKQEPAKKPGPLKLQDHKHPVQFRNFWILEN